MTTLPSGPLLSHSFKSFTLPHGGKILDDKFRKQFFFGGRVQVLTSRCVLYAVQGL